MVAPFRILTPTGEAIVWRQSEATEFSGPYTARPRRAWSVHGPLPGDATSYARRLGTLGGVPVLTAATVTAITATGATPRVTLTF